MHGAHTHARKPSTACVCVYDVIFHSKQGITCEGARARTHNKQIVCELTAELSKCQCRVARARESVSLSFWQSAVRQFDSLSLSPLHADHSLSVCVCLYSGCICTAPSFRWPWWLLNNHHTHRIEIRSSEFACTKETNTTSLFRRRKNCARNSVARWEIEKHTHAHGVLA